MIGSQRGDHQTGTLVTLRTVVACRLETDPRDQLKAGIGRMTIGRPSSCSLRCIAYTI
jgi:hypothetical protein